jgi:hypothetical protein
MNDETTKLPVFRFEYLVSTLPATRVRYPRTEASTAVTQPLPVVR